MNFPNFSGIRGELRENGLFLSSTTSMDVIDEIQKFYDGEINFINLPSRKKAMIKVEYQEPQGVALDLQEFGAKVKISPKISLDNHLQPPPYVRRGFPENW